MANKMKITAVAALAVAVFCGAAVAQPAGSPVAKHGQLRVQNGKIVNKDGVPVALRGMSFFWDQWDVGSIYYTAGAVNELADNWKVDVVRVAFSGTNGNAARCKTVADAAVAKGIYVILDYHSHSANSEVSNAQAFFKPYIEDPKPNYIYEIFNEPIGANGQNTKYEDNHQTYWNSTVKPYAETMITYIRANDGNNIIAVGTPYYSLMLGTAVNNPIAGANAANLAYVLHFYSAEHGTDKASPIARAVDAGLAVFVTEFGTTEASGDGRYDFTAANSWFSILDKYSVGWCNWSICNKGESASALTGGAQANGSNWTDNNLTESGKFIKSTLLKYATETRTVTATAGAGGRVTGGGSYPYASTATLTAVPDEGFDFIGWSGGSVTGSSPTVSIGPLYSDVTVSAAFGQAGNLLRNGTFTNNILEWVGSGAQLSQDNGTLKVSITGTGGAASEAAALQQTRIALDGGMEYELSFSAKASAAGKALKVRMRNSNRDRDYIDPPWDVPLTTGMAAYTKTFSMCYERNGVVQSDATAALIFECGGNGAWTWNIDDIVLRKVGASKDCKPLVAMPSPAAGRTVWSVAKSGGGWRLRGPAEAGAVATVYSTSGKAIRSMEARDGLALNMAGVAAGNYFVVVKNRKGVEVYRNRISMVR
ncbi:MAG: cellulase family glycosylhydrolase [Chitinispirillales bacterium]|jgi:endoglucanase|nr:cellulase family glycosylhydrolase [Chitinispirillales bacterium]